MASARECAVKARDLVLAFLIGCAACSTPPQIATDSDGVEQGAHFIRGTFATRRQPDGNTVVLDTLSGLVVFDTGRHKAHVDQIIAYARSRGRPVVAIFNSHWHLDHISGNPALRDAFPGAAVYANDPALSEALAGFLARGAETNRKRLTDPALDPGQREDARTDLATVEAGARLRPSVSIEKRQTLSIDDRMLEVHVARAATAGDLWLYDARAKLVIAGDLVTLPAPFLDTACPDVWKAEFDSVLAKPFERLAPGHGRAMSRREVMLYRDAFVSLLDCAASPSEPASCARAWATSIAPLLDDVNADTGQAEAFAGYYVSNLLRKPETRPAWCAD
jgi:glyoxylase-like metal-dependent hydrolase (beta-lactamase superfamily II)